MTKRIFRDRIKLPKTVFLDSGHERLYVREDIAGEAVKAVGKELGGILGLDDFWTQAMPAALLSTLEHFEPRCSIAAAVAFLQEKGFTVSGEANLGNVLFYNLEPDGMLACHVAESENPPK